MRYFFGVIFILSALLALAATPKYEEAGMVVFENPSDVSNSMLYFGLIIAFTAFILLAVRYSVILKAVIYFLTFISIFYVLSPFVGIFSILISIAIVVFLAKKPHWLLINAAALMLAAGITAIFGISLEPLPVILLLTVLAVYDIISVYRTKHMISLAESVTAINAPMLFIIPKKDGNAYMGVGDVVMPNILVVSAQAFSNSPELGFIKLTALFSLLGGFIGLMLLLYIVEKRGGAHPGLPFVNFGAIVGFGLGLLLSH
ncbi:presenilin family intramembrane aspartyl protease PSH [Archaeoglobus neptunius]|uniref:presenilin family intramembrane aspartyl protease PSH n=1 Tax=Archaeoglobus neptunius TaxID=2798580 RepID=UPI0019285594|nr:presenilin family intramembrane aspartyl protease PSH [Archaeoglobus neptunius]